MNVLIGCEESGIVRSAFRRAGHNAWSCDLGESADGGPHYEGDIMVLLTANLWDLIILHPPCCAMAVSGNRWYGKGMPRHQERIEAVEWTMRLWERAKATGARVAMENPVSVLFNGLDNVQYIQPWQFGHKEMKKTGFALHGLPELIPTDLRRPPEPGTGEYLKWQKVWRMGPSEERKKLRSRTYLGVAEAMAQQWGEK